MQTIQRFMGARLKIWMTRAYLADISSHMYSHITVREEQGRNI